MRADTNMCNVTRTNNFRCKPGDRAVVTRCDNSAHLGRVVRIVRAYETKEFDWVVEFLGTPIWGRSIYSGRTDDFKRVAVFDWNLTPLEGLERSGQQDHQEAGDAIPRMS